VEVEIVGPHELVAEQGHRAQEAHDELVGRFVVQLIGRADLFDAPVVDHDDLVGDLERLLLVVGDEHGGDVHLVVQAAQPVAQLLAHLGVERAERLVEQQHRGLHGEGPGERHALTLPARQLRGQAIGEGLQVHEAQQLAHPLADLLLRPVADLHAERDVARDRQVLERRVVLEHEADVALLRRQLGGVDAFDLHGSLVGELEAGDDPQQRRLAAAARAQQRGQLAVGDRQRHVVHREEVPEALRHVPDLDAHERCCSVIGGSCPWDGSGRRPRCTGWPRTPA
jgi:hypothetical protein